MRMDLNPSGKFDHSLLQLHFGEVGGLTYKNDKGEEVGVRFDQKEHFIKFNTYPNYCILENKNSLQLMSRSRRADLIKKIYQNRGIGKKSIDGLPSNTGGKTLKHVSKKLKTDCDRETNDKGGSKKLRQETKRLKIDWGH